MKHHTFDAYTDRVLTGQIEIFNRGNGRGSIFTRQSEDFTGEETCIYFDSAVISDTRYTTHTESRVELFIGAEEKRCCVARLRVPLNVALNLKHAFLCAEVPFTVSK